MGETADWEAGKSIDSRQCYEANRLGILVPEMKGGYGYSTTAWDLVIRDRGGLIFSPQAGLHENVAALDFESMFPNIIVRRNVSYETVGSDGVNTERPGFMGGFTRSFLERRLHFKHLRKSFSPEVREWLWCEQRQLALKLILVCIYGYSGCYANRFANVRVFQEINRIARGVLVRSLNIALDRGFEVIYGHSDSLFAKKPDATGGDYEELAAEIAEDTGLPIGLDRHFKFLVLLPKTTDPHMESVNHYYGKLTDGSLSCRGIELRRHDTPPYIKRLQKRMMETLFEAEDAEAVLRDQLPKVQRMVDGTCREVSRGEVDPEELIVSKRLRRDIDEYRSLQPHVVAAYLGGYEDEAEFIFVNAEHRNPYLRVMPASMLNGDHRSYDRRKYVELIRKAADNLLMALAPDYEEGVRLRESRLDTYF
jgi:DNA polymerase elongation subunit (family B)